MDNLRDKKDTVVEPRKSAAADRPGDSLVRFIPDRVPPS